MLDIVGYIGMAFVILSFLMTKVKLIRVLNIVGGILCCIYGFITKTYPTAILNLSLVIINSVMLLRLYLNKEEK